MNKFNDVFLAVKKNCDNNGEIRQADCFRKIADEVDIPLLKVGFYLNTLQDLQLIKYSIEDSYIKLTSFGKKQDRLFVEHDN